MVVAQPSPQGDIENDYFGWNAKILQQLMSAAKFYITKLAKIDDR